MGKKKWIKTLVVGLLLMLFSTYFYTVNSSGLFYFVEGPLQDILRKAKSVDERQPDDRIKIVKIDDKSLEGHREIPMGSNYLCAIDRKARAIRRSSNWD